MIFKKDVSGQRGNRILELLDGLQVGSAQPDASDTDTIDTKTQTPST